MSVQTSELILTALILMAVRAAFADPAYAAIESAVANARSECERLSAGLTNGVSVLDRRSLVEVRGGTNIWTKAIQKALDEHEVIVIPASEKPYYIDATLVVPSNRRIEAAGARIRLADGVRTVLLRNANVKDGTLAPIPSGARDDNVSIVGGSWEDCQTARAGYGRSGAFHADRWPRTHLATVGPKSAPYVTKRGNRMEIFDPYVSCTVGEVKVENVRFRGKVPTELIHAVEFKDVNGDGASSGVGRVERLEM